MYINDALREKMKPEVKGTVEAEGENLQPVQTPLTSKYSVWLKGVEDIRVVSEESFRALFDSRFQNRPNDIMKIFLEAYASAVQSAKSSDRFPTLKEVQEKMLRGEVYNVKRRLMRETGFFRELSLGADGVVIIPAAMEFVDSNNAYTRLKFDFENGKIIFPVRKRTLYESIAGARVQQKYNIGNPLIYYLLMFSLISNIMLAVLLGFLIMKL
jgi:hypothetical protein